MSEKTILWSERILSSMGLTNIKNCTTRNTFDITEEEFNLISYDNPLNITVTFELYQKQSDIVKEKILHDQHLLNIRSYVKQKLDETDKITNAESLTTLVNKDEWLAYRQELRDLTKGNLKYGWDGSNLDIVKMINVKRPEIIRGTPYDPVKALTEQVAFLQSTLNAVLSKTSI